MTDASKSAPPRRPSVSIASAGIGLTLTIAAALAVMGAGIGTRLGVWTFRGGFTVLKWGAYLAIASLLASLIGLRRGLPRKTLVQAAAGTLIGLIVLYVPLQWLSKARSVPPIHDITTDTDHPPLFKAILKIREGAPNPSEYGGPDLAAEQKRGYPNLGPAILDLPPDQAFQRALETARAMGWEIVDADPTESRIEATDTTFWFGFKDDIVIRVAPSERGARIDLRSLSRVGKSDVGTNAKRIQNYLQRLLK